MSCPLCRQRKARRQCPALGQTICTVCCGTKRLTEIACPDDCVHLAVAREHPAAAVKRQQALDAAVLVPTIRHLNERQLQLFLFFHSVVARHVPDGFMKLVDEDVAEAASAMAATFETAARGVVYEHTPASLPAQRLATDFKSALDDLRQRGVRVYDHETATVLRALERGAREARRHGGDGDTSYLTLVSRMLQISQSTAAAGDAPSAQASPIIVP